MELKKFNQTKTKKMRKKNRKRNNKLKTKSFKKKLKNSTPKDKNIYSQVNMPFHIKT